MYHACMRMLKDAGVSLVGYVISQHAEETSPGHWTATGPRNLTAVQQEIAMYASEAYTGLIDGIFVDHVSNRWDMGTDSSRAPFYDAIFATIRQLVPSWLVVANSGSVMSDGLLAGPPGGCDIGVTFEGPMSTWDPTRTGGTCLETLWTSEQGAFDAGPWCPHVPQWDGIDGVRRAASDGSLGSRLAALVYGAESLGEAAAQAAGGNYTYLYVTNAPQSAPWSTLDESLWCSLLAALDGSECLTCTPPPSCAAGATADDENAGGALELLGARPSIQFGGTPSEPACELSLGPSDGVSPPHLVSTCAVEAAQAGEPRRLGERRLGEPASARKEEFEALAAEVAAMRQVVDAMLRPEAK